MSTEMIAAGEAELASVAFVQLVACATTQANLSPVMSEAKRMEKSYRARYAENDAVMKSVMTVIDACKRDIGPVVTRENLSQALADARTISREECHFGRNFVAAAAYLYSNWFALGVAPYKGVNGTITVETAELGRERMTLEQAQIARQIVATEVNALSLERAHAVTLVDMEPVLIKPLVVTEAIAKQSETLAGEGPHQVAARLLGSDGSMFSETELKTLTAAFVEIYEVERQKLENPQDQIGVEEGFRFFCNATAEQVMNLIGDAALRIRLEKLAGQNVAYRPPVITPVVPRVFVN